MWTDFEIGYLAGMIDGEGTIYIQYRMQGNCKNYFPRFQICNTNMNVMHWIKEKFGGILLHRKRSINNPKWKDSAEWYTNRGSLDKLLPLLIPHLIIKREHAIVMQEFRNTFFNKTGGIRITSEIAAIRERCFEKLRILNHRGPL